MKQQILTGWNFRRVLSMVLGGIVIIQAFNEKQWVAALFGGGLILMAIFNKTCCGAGGNGSGICSVPTKKAEDI